MAHGSSPSTRWRCVRPDVLHFLGPRHPPAHLRLYVWNEQPRVCIRHCLLGEFQCWYYSHLVADRTQNYRLRNPQVFRLVCYLLEQRALTLDMLNSLTKPGDNVKCLTLSLGLLFKMACQDIAWSAAAFPRLLDGIHCRYGRRYVTAAAVLAESGRDAVTYFQMRMAV